MRPEAGGIGVLNRQRRIPINLSRVQRTAEIALRALRLAGRQIGITFVNNRGIRELNARWRKSRHTTDVLAFPLEGPGAGRRLLGEVVISAERAQAQAHEQGHSLAAEIDLLVIHGILHLTGEKDATVAGARRMRRREMAILGRLYRRPPPSLRLPDIAHDWA